MLSEAQTERPRNRMLERVKALFRTSSSRDNIEDALTELTMTPVFSVKEQAILKNVLGLHDLRVEDVMIPRADIVAIHLDAPIGEVLTTFRVRGHSRFPVYYDTLDDPRGMIHIRDFVDYVAAMIEPAFNIFSRKLDSLRGDLLRGESSQGDIFGETFSEHPYRLGWSQPLASAKILRPVLFIPPSMPALDLLVKMQTTRTHMGLVIDEYGGTYGLVSIEDIVEMIVGDIEDEHDEAENPPIESVADGSFIVGARASLEDVSQVLSTDLTEISATEDIDTIGGLVAILAGRLPARGEIVSTKSGIEFEILDADPRRVKRLRIHPKGISKPSLAANPPALRTIPQLNSAVNSISRRFEEENNPLEPL